MVLSVWKKLCVLSCLCVSLPVYADESSSSVPFGSNGRTMDRYQQNVGIEVSDSLKKENVTLESSLNLSGLSSDNRAVLGRVVDVVYILGSNRVPTDMFLPELSVKQGKELTEEDILQDIRLIYMSGFYKDVSFVHKEENGKLHGVFIVEENPLFKGITISGTMLFNEQQLANSLGLHPGDLINLKTVGEGMAKVTEQLKNAGFPLFALRSMNLTDDGILQFGFSDGIVDGFEIQGNNITQPYVILREIRQDIGKPLNTNSLKRSGQRLYNLGLFDNVDFQMIPASDGSDHVKVLIVVEEANNATVGVGVGYSKSDGATGQFTIGDKNFLGKGDNVQLKWEFGGKTLRNYDFTYVRPYLDCKGTTFSVNLYDGIHESAEYDHGGHEIARFDKRAIGQEISFSRPDSEFTRNIIRLKNRKDEYKEPVGGYSRQYFEDSYNREYYEKYGVFTTAEQRRKENFGTTRSITFSRVYDNRDDVYDPKQGKRNEISFEWAGFGGDFKFRKLSVDQRYYWPMGPKKKPHTLALDLAAGYAWGDMPLSQRFSVGGASTLRGYEDGQFRGNSMLRASLEYRVPIAKKVSLLAFVDSGYAWDKRLEDSFDLKKLKVGYGLGVRVNTPLGPVKLDYGFGKREEGSGYRGRFHFSFGVNF